MNSRPCKPDADLQWLWQKLLPGTPLPNCPVPDTSKAAASDGAKREKARDRPAD
jgi:hypothetical protein